MLCNIVLCKAQHAKSHQAKVHDLLAVLAPFLAQCCQVLGSMLGSRSDADVQEELHALMCLDKATYYMAEMCFDKLHVTWQDWIGS